IPSRLMLSPAQDALFRTPLPIPPEVFQQFNNGVIGKSDSPVPLWFAKIDESSGSSSVRAVWSPDFRPRALIDSSLGSPPRGPWAPWALPKAFSSKTPPSADFKEIFRTSLDAYDRHELVLLTSVHGLPARGRRKADGSLSD